MATAPVYGLPVAAVSAIAQIDLRNVVVTSPDPTSDTRIPGVVVVFALGAPMVVRVWFGATYAKSSGSTRQSLWLDGVRQWPAFSGSDGTIMQSSGQETIGIVTALSVGAGLHTLEMKEQADASTADVTWGHRFIVVTRLV